MTGAPVTVAYTTSGTLGSPFTAYISNDGFTTKTAIGSGASPISGVIPSTVASGSTYRIRVEDGTATPTFNDNGTDLRVVNYQTNEVTAFAATASSAQSVLSWTKPSNCIMRTVVVASTAAITATPTGMLTASPVFGGGTNLGTTPGQFVVYDGTGSTVTVTGLTNGTPYFYKAFTTNGDGYSAGVTATATPVAVPPTLNASPNSLTAFNTLAGTPSVARSYTLSGTNLVADVTVTAPAGFEVSATSATAGFAPTLTLTPAQLASPVTIFVRLPGTTPGTFGGTGNPVANTTGAVTRNVAVTGTVVGKPAATPAPTVTAGTPTAASVLLALTSGTGTNLLVVVRPVGTAAVPPTDGTTYPASATYNSASTTGTSNSVVFAAANAASVTVTGLAPGTTYVADVYSYNVGTATGFENYQPAGGTSGPFTTAAVPPSAPGVLLLEDDFDYAAGELLTDHGWTGSGSLTKTIAGNGLADMYPKGAALSALTPDVSTRVRIITNRSNIIQRPFTTPVGATTLYAAAVVNLSNVENGNDYFLSFLSTSGGTAYYGQISVTKVAGSNPERFTFGFQPRGSASVATNPTVFKVDTSYVLVLKIEKPTTGNQDVYSLYVLRSKADLSQEPATPLITVSTQSVFNGLVAISIRQQGANTPSGYLDGIRVATGWGAAVGNPIYVDAAATIAPGNYYSVTLANADVLTATGPAQVEKNLTLTSGQLVTTAANLLNVATAGTVTAAAAGTTGPVGYVSGPLARQTAPGAATTLFPIGKGGAYRPITLTATEQTAASTYTAEQFNTGGGTSLDGGNGGGTAPLNRVSSKRYFTVASSNTTAGNFTGTITLSFGAENGLEDYVNTPSSADFVIAKRTSASGGGSSGPWANLGRSANTGTGSGAGGLSVAGTLTSDPFSDFSDFALGAQNENSGNSLSAINPLPVELTAFTAQRQPDGSGVSLKWATATERNSARFEVQRSRNGRDFSTVAMVAAAGTSTLPTTYAALDKAAPATTLYYRLRQVDRDGTFAFSPVATVAGGGLAGKVLLFPNPAQRTISFLAATPTPYRVLSQLGQSLLSGTAEAGTATIRIEQLPTGLYFLELQTATGRTVQKFEKQ